MMKIFAHRGWAEGKDENTLRSFRNSLLAGVDGIELDVRYGADGKTVVLSHDKTHDVSSLTLEEALKYLEKAKLDLLIEFKEYTDDMYSSVVQSLACYDLVERSTIFAFADVAEKFPWHTRNEIKLGIIAPYPHQIKKYIDNFNPDIILLGWGNNTERFIFRIVWSMCSLRKTFAKYKTVKFIIGVAYSKDDSVWLNKQSGLYGYTVDMPII